MRWGIQGARSLRGEEYRLAGRNACCQGGKRSWLSRSGRLDRHARRSVNKKASTHCSACGNCAGNRGTNTGAGGGDARNYLRDLLLLRALVGAFFLGVGLPVLRDLPPLLFADREFFFAGCVVIAFDGGLGWTVAAPKLTSAPACSAAFGTAMAAVQDRNSTAAIRPYGKSSKRLLVAATLAPHALWRLSLPAAGPHVSIREINGWCPPNAISCSTRCIFRPVCWPGYVSLPRVSARR